MHTNTSAPIIPTCAALQRDCYHPVLHALSILTAAATFPLIFVGGLVTSHGAGLSVPDWPTSFGYNMFALPWSEWLGDDARRSGIFYEHSHRLLGSAVGILAILLLFTAWALDRRRSVRWLTLAVLLTVILQGILGGLRVTRLNLDLAIIHACFAQAFFCLTASVAVITSRWWTEIGGTGALMSDREPHTPFRSVLSDETGKLNRLFAFTLLTVALVYIQLILGAVMRHYQAGLAIPDFPLNYGRLLPPADSSGLAQANQMRLSNPNLNTVTLFQIWIHFAHRIGAVVVSLAILYVAHDVIRRFRHERSLRRPASVLLLLLAIQLTLGILTVLMRKPADIASAHVAVGALVLLTSFLLSLRLGRLRALARRGRADRPQPVLHSTDPMSSISGPVIA